MFARATRPVVAHDHSMQLLSDRHAQLIGEDHGRHPGAGLGVAEARRLRADAPALPDHLQALDQDNDALEIDLHRRQRHQAARANDPLQPGDDEGHRRGAVGAHGPVRQKMY